MQKPCRGSVCGVLKKQQGHCGSSRVTEGEGGTVGSLGSAGMDPQGLEAARGEDLAPSRGET